MPPTEDPRSVGAERARGRVALGRVVAVAMITTVEACTAFGSAAPGTTSSDGGVGHAEDARPTDDGGATGVGAAENGTGAPACSPLVLVCDTYKRNDRASGWGVTTSGQLWEGDATGAHFSILDSTGKITTDSSAAIALVGASVGDAEVVVVARETGAIVDFGPILRGQSTNTYYLAHISQAQFEIEGRNAGVRSILGGRTFSTSPDVSYTIRFRAVGTELKARLWRTSDTEPAAWTVEVTDSTIANGKPGFGALGGPTSVLHFEVALP
jgi:hypothetical protein